MITVYYCLLPIAYCLFCLFPFAPLYNPVHEFIAKAEGSDHATHLSFAFAQKAGLVFADGKGANCLHGVRDARKAEVLTEMTDAFQTVPHLFEGVHVILVGIQIFAETAFLHLYFGAELLFPAGDVLQTVDGGFTATHADLLSGMRIHPPHP